VVVFVVVNALSSICNRRHQRSRRRLLFGLINALLLVPDDLAHVIATAVAAFLAPLIQPRTRPAPLPVVQGLPAHQGATAHGTRAAAAVVPGTGRTGRGRRAGLRRRSCARSFAFDRHLLLGPGLRSVATFASPRIPGAQLARVPVAAVGWLSAYLIILSTSLASFPVLCCFPTN